MLYEIFYSNGGHSSGYASKLSAKMSALQRLDGDRTMDWVDIRTSSIRGTTIARITREHLCIMIDELGRIPAKTTTKMNMAQFEVKTTVMLCGVSDAELNNSEVLHPEVLMHLRRNLEVDAAECEITLDEVYELDNKDA